MIKKYYVVLLVLAGFLLVTRPATSYQLLDLLFLTDGTSVSGVIMEEEPGRSLVIETEDGQLLKYNLEDIQRIEKKLLDEEQLIENRDVVYLKDGVVFRGTIVGQDPGRELTLELEDGQLLRFQLEEIFKITKEQVASGIAKRVVLQPKKAQQQQILITIQIMQKRLDTKQSSLKPGMEASAEQSLKEEIARLQEEMAALDEEREAIAKEVEQEDLRFAKAEGELGGLRDELLDASEEISARIAACSTPELREQLYAKYEELDRGICEILQRAEVVALLEHQDPRITQIEVEQKTSQALAITQNQLWKHPDFRDQLAQLVDELPLDERQRIYGESRLANPGRAMARNLIPLMNLGSWRQKDYLGASIGTGTTLGGAGLSAVTALIASNQGRSRTETEDIVVVSGLVVAAAGYVFSLVEPFFFVRKYNDRLADALNLSSTEQAMVRRQIAYGDAGPAYSEPIPARTFTVTVVRYEY